jgi:hypothetical protein
MPSFICTLRGFCHASEGINLLYERRLVSKLFLMPIMEKIKSKDCLLVSKILTETLFRALVSHSALTIVPQAGYDRELLRGENHDCHAGTF